MAVEEINSSNFSEKISKGKSIVDFWAEFCSPCKMFAPIFKETSNEMENVKFFKLDVEAHGDVAQQYEIRGIPTLILFKDGKEYTKNPKMLLDYRSKIAKLLEKFNN